MRSRGGIQYVEHTEGHGEKLFEAVCDLGLEGIVSKPLTAVYRSGPSKICIKIKNPKAPVAPWAAPGRRGPAIIIVCNFSTVPAFRRGDICQMTQRMTVADEYRLKAAALHGWAQREHNADLRRQFESLSRGYLLLAEQAERNATIDTVAQTPC